MSLAPATAVAAVPTSVTASGAQTACVWVAIQGSAARSSRTFNGRNDARKAAPIPTRAGAPVEVDDAAVLRGGSGSVESSGSSSSAEAFPAR